MLVCTWFYLFLTFDVRSLSLLTVVLIRLISSDNLSSLKSILDMFRSRDDTFSKLHKLQQKVTSLKCQGFNLLVCNRMWFLRMHWGLDIDSMEWLAVYLVVIMKNTFKIVVDYLSDIVLHISTTLHFSLKLNYSHDLSLFDRLQKSTFLS